MNLLKVWEHLFKKQGNTYQMDNKTRCPCIQCLNVRFHDLVTIEQHLIRYGFSSSYNKWIHHDENIGGVSCSQTSMPSDRDGCAVNENYVEDDNYVDDDIIVALMIRIL